MKMITRQCRARTCWLVAAVGGVALLFCGSVAAQRGGEEQFAPPMKICEADLGPPVVDHEVTSGSLLLRTDHSGLFVAAPTVRTKVDLRVRGIVVRGSVRQTFHNPTAFWVEGRYVFPLPENAAVDRLRMRVGDRVIEGEIQEKQQARQTFERAAHEGHRASLVEQQRPNVFTAQVANLGPGEEIQIEIGYLQVLRWVDGGYRLRFPTLVAPRFGGLPPQDVPEVGGPRAVLPCADVSTRGARLAEGAGGNLELTVEIEAGGPLATLDSPSHPVSIELETPFLHLVRLAPEAAGPAPVTDRDFELTWRPATFEDATARAFVEEIDGEFFTLLLIYPPAPDAAGELSLPRETIFVIDTSGSMHGGSLSQAKRALITALERLRPQDSFNVIQFDSDAEALFESSVPVGRYSLEQALAYVADLESSGGTNIRAALALALTPVESRQAVRQVVFVTDGAVGNETELFESIRSRLGTSRLFTVGIGSAPNSFFMRKAAQFGRGTFTHIGSLEQVEERMTALLEKLEAPVLMDLIADWGDPGIEAFPSTIPDLYAGEPLVVVGRGFTPLEGLTLSGSRGSLPSNVSVTLPEPLGQGGVAKLWARRKLSEISDALVGSTDPEPLRADALELALGFELVSRFTSLVAVDRSPARPSDEVPVIRSIPLRVPAGWMGSESNGSLGLPATATKARSSFLLGLALLAAAALLWVPRRSGASA